MRVLTLFPEQYRNHLRKLILKYRVALPRELSVEFGESVLQVGMWRPAHAVRFAKSLGHDGEGIIVEATESAVNKVRQALDDIGCRNIKVINVAAWHTNTEIEFNETETPAGSKVADVELESPKMRKIGTSTVIARRMDDLLKEHNVNELDYLEVTVNGAELDVLNGMPNTLSRTKRLLVAGMMRNAQGEPANLQVKEYLEKRGFTAVISNGNKELGDGWGKIDGHVYAWR